VSAEQERGRRKVKEAAGRPIWSKGCPRQVLLDRMVTPDPILLISRGPWDVVLSGKGSSAGDAQKCGD
jgi:hypothetical protein